MAVFNPIGQFVLLTFFYILIASVVSEPKRVKVNFLALISQSGALEYFSQLSPMLDLWQEHLNNKSMYDPTWPYDATVEFVDAKSSEEFCIAYLNSRLNNKSLPNITALIAPEYGVGLVVSRFLSSYNIPVVGVESDVDTKVKNAFHVIPKVSDKANSLINLYVQNGVKSMVSVSLFHSSDTYNNNLCFDAAALAKAKGIRSAQVQVYPNYNQSDFQAVIIDIKNKYNPDAILWCDWEACYYDDAAAQRNPLPAFKSVGYLPKALSMTDCMGFGVQSEPAWADKFQYVTSGMFSHPKMDGGLLYTEDAYPYSSHFRTPNSFNLSVSCGRVIYAI